MSTGTDALAMPQGDFEDLVWHWLTRNMSDQNEYDKLRAKVWKPPKGVVATTGPWSAEAETAAFAALGKQLKPR